MPAKKEERALTGEVTVMDDSVEAVSQEKDTVLVFLKSGNVINIACMDDVHAALRYEEAKKSIRLGQGAFSETTVIDAQLDEYVKETSSEETTD